MEDSVGCGGTGGVAGHSSLGPPRPPSAPLVKVVPAAPDQLADVITAPLRDVINPNDDVTLRATGVALTAGAALLAKVTCLQNVRRVCTDSCP